jgi:hypothetical protein
MESVSDALIRPDVAPTFKQRMGCTGPGRAAYFDREQIPVPVMIFADPAVLRPSIFLGFDSRIGGPAYAEVP